MLSRADMQELGIAELGGKVRNRYISGHPLVVSCGGTVDFLVHDIMRIPSNHRMLDPDEVMPFEDGLHVLAALAPLRLPNGNIGAAMVLDMEAGLLGVQMLDHRPLYEISNMFGVKFEPLVP